MTKATLPKLETGLYDEDFALWLEQQVTLLREGRFDNLDMDNLLEEVEAIGRSDKREVQNRLIVLLAHLLKYQFQANRRSRSWQATIGEQRRQLELIFKDSPSLLKQHAPAVLAESYGYARRQAQDETGLAPETFPEACPYTLEQLLDEDFLAEAQALAAKEGEAKP
ncbi:DUF29 domain-containing protein [soil metagenome]|jgi:hypothetical protein|nr:DUF29 domain-containing protein [Deinococcota bacterium]